MQNRRIDMNIARLNLLAPQIYDIHVDSARCFSGYSLLLRILNAKLTVLTAMLTPFPRLTRNKYYASQDSNIDFRVVLSMPARFVLHEALHRRLFLLHWVSSGACYSYLFPFI